MKEQMGRSPCCEKNGLKKGPWTQEEDQKLIDYIQKNGYGKWRSLPKNAGLQRCGKSCRLRWTNYLRPDIKRGRFSLEEEETIIHLHSILGNKWSAIAARLPGRTDNEIKNFWNTHIRKKLLRMGIDPVTHNPRLDLLDLSSILTSVLCNDNSDINVSRLLGMQAALMNPQLMRLANSLLASQQQSHEFLMQNNLSNQIIQNPVQDVLVHNPCVQLPNHENQDQWLVQYDDVFGSLLSTLTEDDYAAIANYGSGQVLEDPNPSSKTSTFRSNGSNRFGFGSGLSSMSTPSSSPTPLNSNSTTYNNYNNNRNNFQKNNNSNQWSVEDERVSYCSSLLQYEVPAGVMNVNGFI